MYVFMYRAVSVTCNSICVLSGNLCRMEIGPNALGFRCKPVLEQILGSSHHLFGVWSRFAKS
jgi:hypothetical protein